MSLVVPREAGRAMFDLTRIRPLRIGLIVMTVLIVIAIPIADHKAWPVTMFIGGFGAAIGGIGFAVRYYLIRTLVALCEHGYLERKHGEVTLVPWSAVTGLYRRLYQGRVVAYLLETNEHVLGFGPHALGNSRTREALAFVEKYTRSRFVDGRPARMAPKADRYAWSILGLIALLGILYCVFNLLDQRHKIADYDPVDATIVTSNVRAGTQSTRHGQETVWEPAVVYRFSVGGKIFTGTRMYPDGNSSSTHAADVLLEVSRFVAGATVTASFDPADPSSSFLVREINYVPLACAAIFLPLAIGGLVSFIRLRRRDREQIPPARIVER